MTPERLFASRAKLLARIFGGMVVVSVVATAGTVSPATAPPTPRSAQFWDSLSPGFFSPPPGVRPVNPIIPNRRFPHARRSYAWRVHGNRRELVTFSTPIQHVVVIYMENRTPENLFGALYNVRNPSTGNTFGTDLKLVDPSSLTPPLSPQPLTYGKNPGHKHEPDFYDEATNGVWPTAGNDSGYWYVPTAGPSPSVSNYIALIEDWAYENSTLQSNEGPSFVAHQYAIAGQSGGLSNSNIAPNGMSENPDPSGDTLPGKGTCFSTTAHPQTVAAVGMYGAYPTPSTTPPSFSPSPCADYTTILDAVASAAPTTSPYYQWQYIAMDTTSIWSAPMAVMHLYQTYSADPNPSKTGQPFAVDPDAENFVLNITSSVSPTPNPPRPFAELTFITPCLGESDHPNTGAPGGNSFDDGPDWLAYVLNAIGRSLYWETTAVIVTWDDWGGFYDNYRGPSGSWPYHPPGNPYSPTPPAGGGNPEDPNEWGFRVPLLLISPYVTSEGYISSTVVSQGAVLNFIESTFDLPTLGGDDATNGSNDLTDMINPSATPMNWTILPSNFTPSNDDQCPTPTPQPSAIADISFDIGERQCAPRGAWDPRALYLLQRTRLQRTRPEQIHK